MICIFKNAMYNVCYVIYINMSYCRIVETSPEWGVATKKHRGYFVGKIPFWDS